jgi:hypothetical protein
MTQRREQRVSLKDPEVFPSLPHNLSLEAIYHHLPLSLVLPEIPEDLFLLWVVLSDSLKAAPTQPSMYLSSRASLR